MRLGNSGSSNSSSGKSNSSSNSNIRLDRVTPHLRLLLEDRLVRREVVVMVTVLRGHSHKDLL